MHRYGPVRARNRSSCEKGRLSIDKPRFEPRHRLSPKDTIEEATDCIRRAKTTRTLLSGLSRVFNCNHSGISTKDSGNHLEGVPQNGEGGNFHVQHVHSAPRPHHIVALHHSFWSSNLINAELSLSGVQFGVLFSPNTKYTNTQHTADALFQYDAPMNCGI